uniref:Uncharacterized protein n=1 Tax=Arion vulgaris TaxID=1028688 RepID=A0A0B6XZL0_9EUPU
MVSEISGIPARSPSSDNEKMNLCWMKDDKTPKNILYGKKGCRKIAVWFFLHSYKSICN